MGCWFRATLLLGRWTGCFLLEEPVLFRRCGVFLSRGLRRLGCGRAMSSLRLLVGWRCGQRRWMLARRRRVLLPVFDFEQARMFWRTMFGGIALQLVDFPPSRARQRAPSSESTAPSTTLTLCAEVFNASIMAARTGAMCSRTLPV